MPRWSTSVTTANRTAPGAFMSPFLDNRNGDVRRVTAQAVVMAGGQWMYMHVVRDTPAELLDAMATFQHAPMLVANVAVRQWRFMEELGITSARWFGGRIWFTNVRAPLSLDGEHMPLHPDRPTVLTFYIPFTLGVSDQGLSYDVHSLLARTQLFVMPYREIEISLKNQLSAMFGAHGFDHERDIAAIIANRWDMPTPCHRADSTSAWMATRRRATRATGLRPGAVRALGAERRSALDDGLRGRRTGRKAGA